jgi:hypothetical protein
MPTVLPDAGGQNHFQLSPQRLNGARNSVQADSEWGFDLCCGVIGYRGRLIQTLLRTYREPGA